MISSPFFQYSLSFFRIFVRHPISYCSIFILNNINKSYTIYGTIRTLPANKLTSLGLNSTDYIWKGCWRINYGCHIEHNNTKLDTIYGTIRTLPASRLTCVGMNSVDNMWKGLRINCVRQIEHKKNLTQYIEKFVQYLPVDWHVLG